MTTTSYAGTPDVFHRRHNTTPRTPMTAAPFAPVRPGPPRENPSADPDVVALRPEAEPRLLLADLTSPWAYLAHLRFDQPGHEVDDSAPVWRSVQPPTDRPLVGAKGPCPERNRLRRDLAAVRALAHKDEQVPDEVPTVIPHPRPVAAAYAEAVDLGRGPQVRALLLRTYWLEGRDIGDPEVLRRILPSVLVDDGYPCTGDPRREWGYVVSPQRQPLSNAAYHLMERWQHHWEGLGRPGPLTLVGPNGLHTRAAALQTAAAADAA
jgi:hypothetical protein